MVVFDTEDERKILRHIVDGLGAAIDATDNAVAFGTNASDDFRNERDIRTNKLVQQAVEAADLPVFWSWFRYGQSVANEVAMGREIPHQGLADDEAEATATDAHPNAKSKRWYRDFFIEEVKIGEATGIEQICEMSLQEFLRAAYEDAPEEHQPLYLANLEMQEILRTIALSEEWHTQNQDGEFYTEVWKVSRRFQRELILHDELPVTDAQLVTKYLRLVRQATAAVCAMDEDKITNTHQDELYCLAEVYHEPVWKLPAMRISSLTVTGRNQRSKRTKFRETADNDLRQAVETQTKIIQRNLKDSDLVRSRDNWTLSNNELRPRMRESESALFS